MSKIEETLGIPDTEAMNEAMNILNVGESDKIELKDIKKAIDIIDESAKNSGINLLPENTTSEDLENIESEEDNNPIIESHDDLPSINPAFESEMDDIAEKAMYAHEELLNFSMQASSGKSMGDIASAAAKFLDTALEARREKQKQKLATLRLQIEERKISLAEKKNFKDLDEEDPNNLQEPSNDKRMKFSSKDRENLLNNN